MKDLTEWHKLKVAHHWIPKSVIKLDMVLISEIKEFPETFWLTL